NACGLQPLQSGSRWFKQVCTACETKIHALHHRCGMTVVPIGSHSIHGPGMLVTKSGETRSKELNAFAKNLVNWFERNVLLQKHAEQVVLDTCALAGLPQDPTLSEYRIATYQFLHHRSRRLRKLFEQFSVPTTIIDAVLNPPDP
ncbi:MAG: hypothetical protein ACK5OB_18375, partial [Pirellula sp.]